MKFLTEEQKLLAEEQLCLGTNAIKDLFPPLHWRNTIGYMRIINKLNAHFLAGIGKK